MGGPCRERIRVYANGWYSGAKTPEAYAAKAKETVARGFNALKFDPFPGPWRTHISREAEQQVVETVRAVRDAVGPKVDLLIEVHRRLAPMHAVRVARSLEPFEPFWFEEPVSARDMGALAECRRDIRLPIVTGEELYTKFEFREVFERRAADIINPDVCNVGGIQELREIAAMAEAYHVVVSPHNYNSTTLGLAATLHVSAAIPNFLITEYFVNFESRAAEVAVNPFRVDRGLSGRADGAGARRRAPRGRAAALRRPGIPGANDPDAAGRGSVGGESGSAVAGSLPAHARVVVIGGGIAGCSVAYHLTKLGWRDVLLLERRDDLVRHHLARGRAGRASCAPPRISPGSPSTAPISTSGWRRRPARPRASAAPAASASRGTPSACTS